MSIYNAVKAVKDMVVNPVQTAQNIGSAVGHAGTGGIAKSIAQDYSTKWSSETGRGEIVGEIAITALTLGIGTTASGSTKVAQVAKITSAAEKETTVQQLAFDFMKEPALSGKTSGLVIGRSDDLINFSTGEYRLGWQSVLENPYLGVNAEKQVNLSKLSDVMNQQLPIRDASLLSETGGTFLQTERQWLNYSSWSYYNGYWYPWEY
jgi:hypothetical protein